MTLPSELTKVSYNGNGSTVEFTVTFIFWDNTDIRVVHLATDGTTETTWIEGTQYTLTGGDGATGTLTVKTSPTDYTPATGEKLLIKSARADTQDDALPAGGPFPSAAVEQALDQLTRLIQQKEEELGRSITLAETSTFSNITFPNPVENKGLKFIAGKFVVTDGDIENLATDAATSAAAASASASAAAASAAITASEILLWNFDTNQTIADPGTGDIRTNAGATVLAISAISSAAGAPDVSDLVASWDDSNPPANKGTIMIRSATEVGVFATWKISGAITDNGTWLEIPVTLVDSNGLFGNGDVMHVDFAPSGDSGSSADVTTKGDLQTFDTVPARLPVGANAKHLVPDSAQSTGLKWQNQMPYLTKNSTYTVTVSDQGSLIGLSGADFTVTLPPAATAGAGFLIGFKHADALNSREYTIDGDGAESVEGNTTQKITQPGDVVWYVSTGAAWFKVSEANSTYIIIQLVANDGVLAVGTGLGLIPIPWGKRLVAVHAEVATAGLTGLTTIDINKNGTTMLSTKITLDSGEEGSDTASTPAVISVSEVAENDVLTFDVDGISSTAPLGLTIRMQFA